MVEVDIVGLKTKRMDEKNYTHARYTSIPIYTTLSMFKTIFCEQLSCFFAKSPNMVEVAALRRGST